MGKWVIEKENRWMSRRSKIKKKKAINPKKNFAKKKKKRNLKWAIEQKIECSENCLHGIIAIVSNVCPFYLNLLEIRTTGWNHCTCLTLVAKYKRRSRDTAGTKHGTWVVSKYKEHILHIAAK